jgi:CheY-like chemotaxis protein
MSPHCIAERAGDVKRALHGTRLREAKGQSSLSYFGVIHGTNDLSDRMVVLLVDDDRNDQALFALAVDQADAPLWVHNTPDCQQAIDYLEGHGRYADRALHPAPNLVLLDLKMDVGDGFEFLAWRQHSEQFRSLPVILFTGSQYQRDIERALQMGATAHLNKPLAFRELVAAVKQICALAKQLYARH